MSIRSGPLWASALGAALLTIGSAGAVPRDSREAIDRIAGGSDTSVVVAARGQTLYERAGAKGRTPASVQKLLLSMALFDEFGSSHRIKTRVQSMKGGGAIGNLWVVGGGDPSMVSGHGDATRTGIQRLANHIERAGIERVNGSVIVDSSLFAGDWHAPGWQSWSRDFANRPTALAVDGNGMANPPFAFGVSLTDSLEGRGIEVGHEARSGRAPRRAQTAARVRSAPLRALATHMNVTSSNFYAETLGKLLGARTYQAPGSMSKGARAIEEFAARHGVELIAHDSSGLSYANRVSAHDIVTLLEHARRHPWGRALRLSLPSPGQGTLASRLEGLHVQAKTGTLWNGASALAGWVQLRNGTTAEFAILSRDAGKSIEDAIVKGIATDVRAPRGRAKGCKSLARAVTRCQSSSWWEEIGPPARTPE